MKIETDIPIPPKRAQGKFQELLGRMEVGNSVFFPDESNVETSTLSARIVSKCHHYGKKHSKSFCVRSIKPTAHCDNGTSSCGGVRCWRIK